MKTVRLLLTVICFITIMTSVGCSSAKINSEQMEKPTVFVTEDFPHYSNVEDLTKRADLVVKGTILSSKIVEIDDAMQITDKDEKLNPGGNTPSSKNLYTVYTVKVIVSYKGEVKPGDTIEVKQLGGELNGKKWVVLYPVEFISNKNYIMFLATYPNSPACLLNPIQAAYSDELDVDNFKSINKENDLKLSTKYLDDLMQKKQKKISKSLLRNLFSFEK